MSRVTFVALATFLTVGSTSAAFACCGAPAYAPAPAYYAPAGCGGCAPAPVTYVPAVEVAPPPPPVQVAPPAWSGGCGCGQQVVYAAPPVEVTPIAPAPIYVVNQGPDYSGPGIMVPYHTYSPAAAWAPANGYPYVRGPGYGYGYGSGYGYRHHGPWRRYAYREHGYMHPYHRGPSWRARYYSRPLGARG